tara:strand:+ start:247 stop:465 length:219 start_codon:yes stop_codon:yes gene_type:complete
MTQRTVKHEIKLQKSVVVVLGILAFGVVANAFAPALDVEKALADDYYIIERILYCIDGSQISGNTFITYCNS